MQINQKGDCPEWAQPSEVDLLKAGSEVRGSKPQRPLLPPEYLEMPREPSWAQTDGAEVMEDTRGEKSVSEREARLFALPPPRGSRLP